MCNPNSPEVWLPPLPIASVLLFLSSLCQALAFHPPSLYGPIPVPIPILVPPCYARIMPFFSWQPLVVRPCHCRRETEAYLLFPLAEKKLILPSLVGLTMNLHRARLTFFFQLTGTSFARSVSSHLCSLTLCRLFGCQPAGEGN